MQIPFVGCATLQIRDVFRLAVSAPWYGEREKAGTEWDFSIPAFVEPALGRALLHDRGLTSGLVPNLAFDDPMAGYS